MTTTTADPTTDLVLHAKAIERIKQGVTLPVLLELLRPTEKQHGLVKNDLPKPLSLNDRQRALIHSLPDVIDAAVCPAVRRELEPDEITKLLDERESLDAIDKVIKARLVAQKAAAFNHHDVLLEKSIGDAIGSVEVDEAGHYINSGYVGDSSHDKGFVRSVREGGPVLTADALKDQVGSANFSHEDYLACTTSVRVLDEAKVLLFLRKRPDVVVTIAKATQPGKRSTAHLQGKEK